MCSFSGLEQGNFPFISVFACGMEMDFVFSLSLDNRFGAGGYSLIKAIQVCAAPSSRVFAPLWSENAYTLCPFWSGIGYGFRGNYGSV